jgi:hypothetical protein
MDNNDHAIISEITSLNKNNKHSFLLLTKYILEIQKQYNLDLLNIQHGTL